MIGGSSWRFIDSGSNDAFYNMAVDEMLFHTFGTLSESPVLRIYNWHPPAISLGYFQPYGCIDTAKCLHDGVDIVRRITGGRAVYHDSELTYSLIVPANVLPPVSISGSFKFFSRGFLAAFESLGIRAEVKKSVLSGRSNRHKSPFCFSSVSRYEIVAGGKKVLGSAQRRSRGVILQQGSILFDDNVHKLSPFLAGDGNQEDRRNHVPPIAKNGFTGNGCNGITFSYEEVREALKDAFERCYGLTFVPSRLSCEEACRARDLKDTKYATAAWNRQKNR
jgi:lipoate-protein ligase A